MRSDQPASCVGSTAQWPAFLVGLSSPGESADRELASTRLCPHEVQALDEHLLSAGLGSDLKTI